MSDVTYGFTCRNPECEADLVAELTDCSRGYAGFTSGLPEYCYPGEGPDWAWPADIVCDECGAVHDQAWMEANLKEGVIDRLSEPDDDGPEFYADESDHETP